MANAEDFHDPSADLDANGVDLNRLRRNLARTPEERIERNRQAAIKILECRRAAESAGLRKPHSSP
jgi:hypothetical protein